MAATLAQFRSQVPAMAAVPDATVNTWLALTLPRITASLFGTEADTAQVWLTAHEIAREPTGTSPAVPVVPGATSITVGPVSVTYGTGGAGAGASGGLGTTVYGQRYDDMVKVAMVGAASLIMAEPT